MKNEGRPLVSIIIPVKNGDSWLPQTLPALLNQTLADQTEIIVIDSGSTDNTLSILSQFPIRVINISPETFNHGTVRNLGAAEATGRYVVMTVQDARPADEKWLEKLLAGFNDPGVAGVCGQQVVSHDTDKNPVAWFRPQADPAMIKYSFKHPQDFDALAPGEKKRVCSWDNVNAAYRRDILLKIPFQKVSFAEDALWARDVIRSGYSLVYNSAARVYHYHFETPDFTFRRHFTVYYHFYRLFDVKPSGYSNELVHVLKNLKLLVGENQLSWKQRWKWLRYNHYYRKAVNKAVKGFHDALQRGDAVLTSTHSEICDNPPQALKPV